MIYLFLALSAFLSLYDIKYKKVPNWGNLILLIIAIVHHILEKSDPIYFLISGALALGTFLLVYILIKGKLGIGDIKYTTVTAIFFGYEFWVKSVFIASAIAFIISITLFVSKRITRVTRIPFVPFLFLGIIVCFLHIKFLCIDYVHTWR